MKTIKRLLIIVCVLMVGQVSAQNAKFTEAMQKGFAMLDAAKEVQDFQGAANHFERISTIETTAWQPLYYAANSSLIAGIVSREPGQKDELFDKAIALCEKANKLKEKDSEITALLAYATFMKMSVDPMKRAMVLIPEANALLDNAIKLNPENPRPYLVRGQTLFYTPEAFGGGKATAEPFLQEAKKRFDKETKTDVLSPTWGKARCEDLLAQCKK